MSYISLAVKNLILLLLIMLILHFTIKNYLVDKTIISNTSAPVVEKADPLVLEPPHQAIPYESIPTQSAKDEEKQLYDFVFTESKPSVKPVTEPVSIMKGADSSIQWFDEQLIPYQELS
jgi:hypothetical protein